MIWTFYGKRDRTATSGTLMQRNHHAAMTDDCGDLGKTATDHDDYITLDDIFGKTNGYGDDGGFNDPEDVELIEEKQRHSMTVMTCYMGPQVA
jgi:hypothetical protein